MEKPKNILIVGAGPHSCAIRKKIEELSSAGCLVMTAEEFNKDQPHVGYCATDEALAVPSEPVFQEPVTIHSRKDLKYYPVKGSKYHK